MTNIEAPTNCPSCRSVLEEVNYLLYCRNPHCGEKVLKLIEHFAKTLKIKGLGPKSIAKLDIVSLEELYSLDALEMAKALGSERLAAKLVDELELEFYQQSMLPFSFKFENNQTTNITHGTVCISGKLTSYKTKAEAHNKLQELGYAVKTSLTKDVTILVNESGVESAKTKKARDAGVQIITNLLDFIGE